MTKEQLINLLHEYDNDIYSLTATIIDSQKGLNNISSRCNDIISDLEAIQDDIDSLAV